MSNDRGVFEIQSPHGCADCADTHGDQADPDLDELVHTRALLDSERTIANGLRRERDDLRRRLEEVSALVARWSR